MWSKWPDGCKNCGTTRRRYGAKGYCTKCYRLILRLERVHNWDYDKPDTLGDYPYRGYPAYINNRQMFTKKKDEYQRRLEDRLRQLSADEELLAGPVDGITIEFQLRELARRCKVQNKNLMFGKAGFIDANFSAEQRQVLYRLLLEIEEDIPRRVDVHDLLSHSRRI